MSPKPTQKKTTSDASQFTDQILRLLTDGVCGLAVVGIVVVVLIQVLGRLMDAPFSWTEELTRGFFIWMVFSGMAASVRHADSARVTVLLRYFPRFVKRSALAIYVVCSLGFFGLVAWTGWSMVRQQIMMNEKIATLDWPGWTIGMVLPAAAVLSIFSLFQSLRTHKSVLAAEDQIH